MIPDAMPPTSRLGSPLWSAARQGVAQHFQEDPFVVIWGLLSGGVGLTVEGQAVSVIARGSAEMVLADLGKRNRPKPASSAPIDA